MRTLALTFCLVIFGISSFHASDTELSRGSEVPGERPLWKADLRSFGLTKRDSWDVASSGLDVALWSNDTLAFAGENQLIASFLTREGEAQVSPRRLHTVFLDATTGKIVNAAERTGPVQRIGLMSLRNGRFVVRTRFELTLYSPELEPLAEFPLPITHRPGDEWWEVSVSPTRDSIIVRHTLDCTVEIQWLDTDNLKPKHSWKDPEGTFVYLSRDKLDVSDTFLVATLRFPRNEKCGAPQPTMEELAKRIGQEQWCELALRNLDGPWRTIFRQPGYCWNEARFLNEDMLFFSNGSELLLLRTSGDVVLKEQMKRHEFIRSANVRSSRNGRRFAVAVETSKGGSQILDISPHRVLRRIMVYDIPSQRWVYSLDMKQLDLRYVSGFALSPDGSKLALLRDSCVELYRLPN